MKLEVGMYVRTDDGYIAKYDNSKHNCSGKYYGFASTIRDLRWEEYDDDCFLWESELKNIIKASNNIIDLIEVGDYVNGNEVMEADWINENGEYEEGLAFPMYASDDLDVIENWLPLRCVDIKSIVTKEQFESISYRVEE